MRLNPVEVVEKQNAIIRIQSGVIDDLFLLLMQHISAEEADALPVIDRINQAAEIRREIE
mgnify:CR=1 FL=1